MRPILGEPGHVGPITERRTVLEMVGEFAREAAVLIAVFVPLDLALLGDLTVKACLFTMIAVGLFLGVGVVIEVKR